MKIINKIRIYALRDKFIVLLKSGDVTKTYYINDYQTLLLFESALSQHFVLITYISCILEHIPAYLPIVHQITVCSAPLQKFLHCYHFF
jgi:hypothetical protein